MDAGLADAASGTKAVDDTAPASLEAAEGGLAVAALGGQRAVAGDALRDGRAALGL